MPRQRFKVKPGLLGSSDFRRVKSSRAILEDNHKKNVAFFSSIKDVEGCKETIITEKYILGRYSRVLTMGQWCPVSKFIGSLVFMYNDNYLFE